MTDPIKHCPQPDPPELVMRADGYHYRTEDEMTTKQRELSDEDLYQLWMGANDKDLRTLIYSYSRALIAADRALNAPADRGASHIDEFNTIMEGITEPPIERLRFFCSLAMSPQDWLDVEPLFTDVIAAEWNMVRQASAGWKLVPVEPTIDQYNAACAAYCSWEVKCQEESDKNLEFSQPNFTHSDVYRAMVGAASTPPAEQQGESLPVMGGRESLGDALAIVDSFGPGIEGLNDTYARQIILADEVKRLRGLYEQGEQQPAAWMFPDDLKEFEVGEHTATAYSIKMGSPDGTTVPLYAHPSPSFATLNTCMSIEQAPPAEQRGEQQSVAYLDVGSEGYLDLDTDKSDDELQKLSPGRHPLYLHPSPTLAELRAKVEALPNMTAYDRWCRKDAVLAEIDKLGGKS